MFWGHIDKYEKLGSCNHEIVVVGHSYGGNVALEFGIQKNHLVCGIVCIDGGFIDLQKSYPDFAACLLHLSPPSFHGTSHADLENLVRRDWCRDWPESGVVSMLKNFSELPDGSVEPTLSPGKFLFLCIDI